MEYRAKFKSVIISTTIGIVYLIFGLLKFFPNLSPAEELATNTIQILTLGILPSHIGLIALAVFEAFIGMSLLLNIKSKLIIYLAIAHIIMTFTPIFLLPEQIFGKNEFTITLLSQYIFKNIIIIGALYTLKMEVDLSEKKVNKRKKVFFNLVSVKI